MKMGNKKYNQMKTKAKIQEKRKSNKQTIKDINNRLPLERLFVAKHYYIYMYLLTQCIWI